MDAVELFEKAYDGDISILTDSYVGIIKNKDGFTPLHILANEKKIEVLSHTRVALVKDQFNCTPLHTLAMSGCIEAINHISVSKVFDIFHNTPLHYLGRLRRVDIINHPDFGIVKNSEGHTPLMFFGIGIVSLIDSPYKDRCIERFMNHPDVKKVKNLYNKSAFNCFISEIDNFKRK